MDAPGEPTPQSAGSQPTSPSGSQTGREQPVSPDAPCATPPARPASPPGAQRSALQHRTGYRGAAGGASKSVRVACASGSGHERSQPIPITEDPYLVLGLSRDATAEEIFQAYRRRALDLRILSVRARQADAGALSVASQSARRGSTATAILVSPRAGGTKDRQSSLAPQSPRSRQASAPQARVRQVTGSSGTESQCASDTHADDAYRAAEIADEFRKINEAHQILGDVNLRRKYDETGCVHGKFAYVSAEHHFQAMIGCYWRLPPEHPSSFKAGGDVPLISRIQAFGVPQAVKNFALDKGRRQALGDLDEGLDSWGVTELRALEEPRDPRATRVVVVRHGMGRHNDLGGALSHRNRDAELNAVGDLQAIRLGHVLRAGGVISDADWCIVSPFTRAIQTGLGVLGDSAQLKELSCEARCAEYTLASSLVQQGNRGSTAKELRERFKHVPSIDFSPIDRYCQETGALNGSWWEHGQGHHESRASFLRRAVNFRLWLGQQCQRRSVKQCLVFSHGGLLRAAFGGKRYSNCEFRVFDLYEDGSAVHIASGERLPALDGLEDSPNPGHSDHTGSPPRGSTLSGRAVSCPAAPLHLPPGVSATLAGSPLSLPPQRRPPSVGGDSNSGGSDPAADYDGDDWEVSLVVSEVAQADGGFKITGVLRGQAFSRVWNLSSELREQLHDAVKRDLRAYGKQIGVANLYKAMQLHGLFPSPRAFTGRAAGIERWLQRLATVMQERRFPLDVREYVHEFLSGRSFGMDSPVTGHRGFSVSLCGGRDRPTPPAPAAGASKQQQQRESSASGSGGSLDSGPGSLASPATATGSGGGTPRRAATQPRRGAPSVPVITALRASPPPLATPAATFETLPAPATDLDSQERSGSRSAGKAYRVDSDPPSSGTWVVGGSNADAAQ